MLFCLYQKTYTSATLSAARQEEWISVGALGLDALSVTVIVTGTSVPVGIGLQFQAANRADKSDAVLVGSAVAISANGTLVSSVDRPPYNYYRLTYSWGSGAATVNASVLGKGDRS